MAAKKGAPTAGAPKKAALTSSAAKPDAFPIVAFQTPAALHAWLQENHASARGVWMKLYKKASGTKSVTWKEIVPIALTWGWIDGQSAPVDDVSWLQRLTPRGPRSMWSKINRAIAEELIAAGKMQPAGLAQVERARADGRFDRAYDSPSTAPVPDDLAAALQANPRAAAFFAALNASNRYAVLWRVQNAKKAATRARRIETFIDMLARGETFH